MEEAISRAARLPCFNDPAEITALGGGITNVNLLVRDRDRQYVVRLGEDIPEHGVQRANELALSEAAEAAGISPAVLYHEPGVLVLEYVEAETFSESQVSDDGNLPRIISLVKKAHCDLGRHLTTPVLTFWPFQVIRTYVTRLQSSGSRSLSALPELIADAGTLELAAGKIDLVVGHNDLLAANILDDGQRLWLIDWEYGGFNSPLFDLAGLAGNNGLSEAQEHRMLEQYFQTPGDDQWRSYQAMKCASLMRETLWSMTSEIHSELDFDYAGYTAENMQRLKLALQDFRNS